MKESKEVKAGQFVGEDLLHVEDACTELQNAFTGSAVFPPQEFRFAVVVK
ncbi:MAG: hypothetical protein GY903_12625 [Fuerstiella sp.]|nr:hypothetical protein [Fuerstiella sp.]MCP4855328.1 hypothetical protein [Fuerstiella sp.]